MTTSKERQDRFVELALAGCYVAEIVRREHSDKTTVKKVLKTRNIEPPTYRRLGHESDALMLELEQKGILQREIATVFHTSVGSVSIRLRSRTGKSGREIRKQKLDEQIVAGAYAGETEDETAERLHISRSTVTDSLRAARLKRNPGWVKVENSQAANFLLEHSNFTVPEEKIRLALEGYLNNMNISRGSTYSDLAKVTVKKIWELQSALAAEQLDSLLSMYKAGIRSIQLLANRVGTDPRTIITQLMNRGLDVSDHVVITKESRKIKLREIETAMPVA